MVEERTDACGRKYYVVSGEITLWVDGAIHIRTSEPHGDPVEINGDEAQDLVDLLIKLIAEIR